MDKKIENTISLFFVLFVLTSCGNANTTALPSATFPVPSTQSITPTESNAAYLGQKAPGSYPSRFASKYIKGDLHTSPVFMPDGSEVYWGQQDAKIITMRLENGSWTNPESIAFSDSMTDYRDPFISPSGDKLFFLSKGKLPDSKLPVKENVWFVERNTSGWGEPQPLNEEVNSYELHWQISVANNGNLFFSSTPFSSDIYVSRYINGQYIKAEKLSDSINSDQLEMTPYIAPDESYIIFSRFKDTNSNPRLFISYADKNGGWSKAILIDKVSYGLSPVVSPDGKFLFFLNSPQSISWMNTEFIEELRPGN